MTTADQKHETIELEVIETEPDIHSQVIEQMQKYAENDIEYSDLVILVTPTEKKILEKHTAQTPDGREYFIDAKVVQHWKDLPDTPMVIPKDAIRRILSESL